ncbi:MAG TPA: COX15/CtaA family protein [Magnetospirillum sp.]|nr:COX15/CtaA family protein [Magnetospirillum sp.]
MHDPSAILPRPAARPLAVWLLCVAAMVAIMVALGGLTRLTGSGLSMVEWNPHHLLPPLSDAQWHEAFALYRQSPEYRLVNAGLDVAGFKSIFWLEYVHRLWGRLIGLAFALPLAVFVVRRAVTRRLALRLGMILALGGLQGAAGWFMVASGLADQPQVSHFRLALHLVLALVILAALLWTALDLLVPAAAPTTDARAARRLLDGLMALTLVAITWGAFVAGLHAGHLHNTFPLMDGALFPPEGLALRPRWLNAVENPSAVQYVHRVLALTVLACLTLAALWSRHARLPAGLSRRMTIAAAAAWVQVGLGIVTLVMAVPVAAAAAHQMAAVTLFALLTWARHGVRSG